MNKKKQEASWTIGILLSRNCHKTDGTLLLGQIPQYLAAYIKNLKNEMSSLYLRN